MLLALSHLIPDIHSGWTLSAFIVLLLVFLAWNKILDRINVIKTSRSPGALRALNATLSRFEVNTEDCSPDQKFKIVIAQILLRRSEYRGRLVFSAFLFVIGTLLVVLIAGHLASSAQPVAEVETPPATVHREVHETRPPEPPDPIVQADPGLRLPFAIRLIGTSNLEDEPASDEDVTVTDSRHPIPTPVLRDGEFFIVPVTERERTTVHIAVSTGNGKVERTVVLSGYIVSQVPCDARIFYLAKKTLEIGNKTRAAALRYLNDVTHCGSLDKALVAWQEIHDRADDAIVTTSKARFKSIGDLIDYNWARGNYQSCVTLGYEQQCEIGETAFKSLSRVNFRALNVNVRERDAVISNVNSMPLEIEYSKIRKLFDSGDYIEAAHAAEMLIGGFDNKAEYWEKIGISKSRLRADASVSWLHYADGLGRIPVPEEEDRCSALRKAFFQAQNTQWYDFRQEHVPLIAEKMRNCAS